jgi:hypothetical protein
MAVDGGVGPLPGGLTAAQCVRGVAGPIGRLGGAWMFDEQTNARGEQLGLSRWSWYHCGRGGVLGDVDASVVVAAFGFFPPALQRKAWERGRAVRPVADTARDYARACAEWGRRSFGSPEDAGRLADLLGTVLAAVDVAGLPLFAAWRAVAAAGPDDGPARLALALQVAREHRGSAHSGRSRGRIPRWPGWRWPRSRRRPTGWSSRRTPCCLRPNAWNWWRVCAPWPSPWGRGWHCSAVKVRGD